MKEHKYIGVMAIYTVLLQSLVKIMHFGVQSVLYVKQFLCQIWGPGIALKFVNFSSLCVAGILKAMGLPI